MAGDTSKEQPFTLNVPDADLNLLRQKLKNTRFPDELDEAGWEYGVPLADVKRLVARWQDGFDWRESEAAINALPQFTRDIEVEGFGTLNIHYLHQKSEEKNAVPLLFVHGWPGHFLEVRKMLPLLTAKSADHPSFHVVAPSLPGFGFSENPKKKGFAHRQYAEAANKLMISLGYDQYVVQGGDWGHYVSAYLSTFYAHTNLKAWLSNFPHARPPTLAQSPRLYLANLPTPYTAREREGLARTRAFEATGGGYAFEQGTKPQTVGTALADSPAGLLAWIYEKLVGWSDGCRWEDDEVLEWVSIYWFSRAGPAASVRIYKEMTGCWAYPVVTNVKWTSIPFGMSHYKDLHYSPKKWLQTLGNLQFESELHERGGHFAAYEVPEALVGDIRKFFGKGGAAFGVVEGKNGYASFQ
ncbi:alpha/beta-hydrolase [Epithele typhae]|uniref:alpha/beta-hydrolase n=1 Tax=Epithele typhae TaxID=378194 RepID=UPI002007433A|nr:alpha/beta-hydrolase [Epithele typhae]KAH9939031.1 alpha/beta-hydrolase [Epithele typhae]